MSLFFRYNVTLFCFYVYDSDVWSFFQCISHFKMVLFHQIISLVLYIDNISHICKRLFYGTQISARYFNAAHNYSIRRTRWCQHFFSNTAMLNNLWHFEGYHECKKVWLSYTKVANFHKKFTLLERKWLCQARDTTLCSKKIKPRETQMTYL